MRDILFSAKRIDNGYTVCGYHVKDGVTGKHFIVAEGSMLHESDKVGEEGLLNFVAFEVDEDTISVTDDGWIPAEERMPEEPKENPVFDDKPLELYLVDMGGSYPLRAFWNGKQFTDGWSILKVIAWRPLPEPYHAERSDNNDGE